MFNQQNQQSGDSAEDMFAEVDGGSQNSATSRNPVNMGNSPFTQQSAVSQAPVTQNLHDLNHQDHKRGDFKYLIIGILSLAVVLVVGWFVYQQILKPRYLTPKIAEENTLGVDYNTIADEPVVENLEITTETAPVDAQALINQVPEIQAVDLDTDGDGLTDTEETALGTNINKIDSDDDGLSDKEEAKVWETNPLDADSDGDGYTDGQEVEGGYNPNGAGKLYEVKKN